VKAEPAIAVEALDHHYGAGALRKQILFDVTTAIPAGEIVIVTGPSGSGKTTLLTLVSALRSAQAGSVRVLGEELRGASARTLERVRRRIGFVFQQHNLLEALTARENVELGLRVTGRYSPAERRRHAADRLAEVGLAAHLDRKPGELTGGQRQRVAIARALAAAPAIVMADEPTASLDKQSGREVVDRMRALSKEHGTTILLVTHDNRILDVADRIVYLEDGRLATFTDAVIANTGHLMRSLAAAKRREDLEERVLAMDRAEFAALLEEFALESNRFLESLRLANDEAYEGLLDQALRAFTAKLAQLERAERASLFLVDAERAELWLRVAHGEGAANVGLRIPLGSGIAGHVAATGRAVRIEDAYADPRFNPEVDRRTGFRTRSILCVPLLDREGQVFAVAQLLNRTDGAPFDAGAERVFAELAGSVAVLLETWSKLARLRLHAAEAGTRPGTAP
jgi:putative ABC transport system ATP-binding protein